MNKKDIAIIAGPAVGALVFVAVNIAAVKIKDHRAKKAVNKKDVITELMEDAQNKN